MHGTELLPLPCYQLQVAIAVSCSLICQVQRLLRPHLETISVCAVCTGRVSCNAASAIHVWSSAAATQQTNRTFGGDGGLPCCPLLLWSYIKFLEGLLYKFCFNLYLCLHGFYWRIRDAFISSRCQLFVKLTKLVEGLQIAAHLQKLCKISADMAHRAQKYDFT